MRPQKNSESRVEFAPEPAPGPASHRGLGRFSPRVAGIKGPPCVWFLIDTVNQPKVARTRKDWGRPEIAQGGRANHGFGATGATGGRRAKPLCSPRHR